MGISNRKVVGLLLVWSIHKHVGYSHKLSDVTETVHRIESSGGGFTTLIFLL